MVIEYGDEVYLDKNYDPPAAKCYRDRSSLPLPYCIAQNNIPWLPVWTHMNIG